MNSNFEVAQQRTAYIENVQRLQRDPWSGLPDWVRDRPDDSLHGRKIVICGTKMPGEVRFIAQHCEVIGMVDDFLRTKQDRCMGLPLMSTSEWVDMARKDKSVVSVIGVQSVLGDDHFSRCIAQHQLDGMRMLDLFRVVAADRKLLAGFGSLFIYGIPFLNEAVKNMDAHLKNAKRFEDEFSQFTYFSMLNYRLDSEPSVLQRCAVGLHTDRYGHDTYMLNKSFFQLGDKEVFVDGGAFDGDTLDQFLRGVDGKFDYIYAFEPSPSMASNCRTRVQHLQGQYVPEILSKIDIVERGLWSKDAELTFNPTQYAQAETVQHAATPVAGHVVEGGMTQHMYRPEDEGQGSFTISVTTIDKVCERPVSLIKLEIEGSELRALHGASQTIENCRPRMSIAMYHKPEDFLSLSTFISDTNQNYRMALRQHNPLAPDATVCYCY